MLIGFPKNIQTKFDTMQNLLPVNGKRTAQRQQATNNIRLYLEYAIDLLQHLPCYGEPFPLRSKPHYLDRHLLCFLQPILKQKGIGKPVINRKDGIVLSGIVCHLLQLLFRGLIDEVKQLRSDAFLLFFGGLLGFQDLQPPIESSRTVIQFLCVLA